jgi:hypothetical protein
MRDVLMYASQNVQSNQQHAAVACSNNPPPVQPGHKQGPSKMQAVLIQAKGTADADAPIH